MSNVIRPAAFSGAAVRNPRVRGRVKGTASFRIAKRKRQALKALANESPYHPSVPYPTTLLPGKYHYPASLLMQKYFCLGGRGDWFLPRLCASSLVDEKFVSPLRSLLDQLNAEGHDVSGARLEMLALREASARLEAIFDLSKSPNRQAASAVKDLAEYFGEL